MPSSRTIRTLRLPAVIAAIAPLFIVIACGGGQSDPKTAATETTTASNATDSVSTASPSASASASGDDDNDEDDSIPTSDVVCKHLQDVLKGKAGALKACVDDLEKKQDDDANYYVCFANCVMPATTSDAVEVCKAKCKK